jgi:branched-chain amino acid transport system ATP-binding protein
VEALRVKNLSKNFGNLQALSDVSFFVESGERRAIIGPNGAGKTTLFNLIAGAYRPSAGQVYLFGHEITDVPQHRRTHLGLARTYQINSLFLRLSIMDNILMAVQSRENLRFQMFRPVTAYGKLFARARELLESVNLRHKEDTLVQDISYGEQRQLEIILALACEPKILLMDEPTAGLSQAEAESVIKMILAFPRDMTTIIVSHDMDAVFGVADRISVLCYGKLIASGTPAEVRADPKVQSIYLGNESCA